MLKKNFRFLWWFFSNNYLKVKMHAFLVVFKWPELPYSVALSKRVTVYGNSAGAARELPKTVMHLTDDICIIILQHTLLPGHKLEWPIFTTAHPVPGHERVKLHSPYTMITKKNVSVSEKIQIFYSTFSVFNFIFTTHWL